MELSYPCESVFLPYEKWGISRAQQTRFAFQKYLLFQRAGRESSGSPQFFTKSQRPSKCPEGSGMRKGLSPAKPKPTWLSLHPPSFP
jgi:hypothetical protein